MADSNSYTAEDTLPEVELRDPRLAAFLAWLVPGLGHLYQRRTGKGLLYMVTILGTFAYGMYLGGGRVVYASTTKPPVPLGLNKQAISQLVEDYSRWHYLCQLPVGLAAVPAYVQTWRVENDKPPLDFFGDNFERPPYTRQDVEILFPSEDPKERQRKYFQSTDQSKEENVVIHHSEREKWHHDHHFFFELGTVYTMIAGLMNVLAICDARWGPLVAVHPQDKKKPEPNENESG